MLRLRQPQCECFLYYHYCCHFYYGLANCFVLVRLEAAASTPETLSQEAIIENLDPVEAARLSKVRNIGIAVWTSTFSEYQTVLGI